MKFHCMNTDSPVIHSQQHPGFVTQRTSWSLQEKIHIQTGLQDAIGGYALRITTHTQMTDAVYGKCFTTEM